MIQLNGHLEKYARIRIENCGLLFLSTPHFSTVVIAGKLEGSWRAGGQQEGLQYNGETA